MIAIEKNAAVILPSLVLEDGAFCVHTLANLSGFSIQTVNPVLGLYESRGWAIKGDMIGHGNRASHNEFTISERLASDVNEANEAITSSLPESDVDLYLSLINVRHTIPRGHEADSDYENESIHLLGGLALLSLRNDLSSISHWFAGQEGWESLVSLRAHFQPRQ